ncbi:MAG: AAA family ATPase [Pirellulales bacterium]
MYISLAQIKRSLPELQDVHPFFGISFLAFKQADIPIGQTASLNFSAASDDILRRHYHPTNQFDGFYQPLLTGNKLGRWVSPRYGSTSLQRITKDTFGGALLHPTQSEWGWRNDYLKFLSRQLRVGRIPAFHLASWLLRDEDWATSVKPKDVIDHFYSTYKITSEEQKQLFESALPVVESDWISDSRVPEYDLLAFIGFPPGYVPREGVSLRLLELRATGPADVFVYEPSERLNIITGDNGLGKTFILDGIWWALTGSWSGGPLLPGDKAARNAPLIAYQLAIGDNILQREEFEYDWKLAGWSKPAKDKFLPGIVIYSRFDGSFSVLDPARVVPDSERAGIPRPLKLSRTQVWEGVTTQRKGQKTLRPCNGLIEDWVLWQLGGPSFAAHFQALVASLKKLSPGEDDVLRPGLPMRLPGDAQEIPTLEAPYGRVPVVLASAGAQRILTLAYVLVWTWLEHIRNSEMIKQQPQRRLALIIDEVEAHLHPRWQRVIVPGIMEVVKELWPDVAIQVHLATHSPLVMASAEPIFDKSKDDLHHLKIVEDKVILEELSFVKRGTADAWLMSDVFGLEHARSAEAEGAIAQAIALQENDKPAQEEIRRIHRELTNLLAEDDEFWSRWRYFALQNGVDE